MRVSRRSVSCVGALLLAASSAAQAETGYDLWLRYQPLTPDTQASYAAHVTAIVVEGRSASARAVTDELQRGLKGMLGKDVALAAALAGDGALVAGTPSNSKLVAGLGWNKALAALGDGGFVIRSTKVGSHSATVIASQGESGVLYGAFHFLRLVQTGRDVAQLDVSERPRVERRMLDHWDNLDGTIERGYAGRSLWQWDELPGRVDPRVVDYARANASIGINATVVNSVNANPRSLTKAYLEKTAALAQAMRPYGLRVYLSVNFAAPKTIGGLPTADPHDPTVAAWWRAKADEIYGLIPDFGGFLVKANSEGQPGPQDYGRNQADGANVLADAVQAHGGVVFWRAFVYNADVDPDRIKRAYLEFVPLDGKFRDNVFVQVKNGPLDFMPREPFHPLFGALPRTKIAAELQITQEYLGQGTHLVYLAPMWREFLQADTFAKGPGSQVAKVVDGTLEGHAHTAIAGVANTGSDPNWCGHHFAQANWYAFGRLAWNPDLTPEAIADEWIRATWGQAPPLVDAIRAMLLDSREAFVDYTMPLGLHHLIGGDHYAPMPENDDKRRADWSAIFYHRADATGIGWDRTRAGSGAVLQYSSPLREQWADSATTPDKLLLWFHRLPWDFKMKSGATLWDELVRHYQRGARAARLLETRWQALRGQVDDERFQAVAAKLRVQSQEAAAWSDKCLRYFQQFSQRAIPEETALKTLVPPGLLIGAALNQLQSDGRDTLAEPIVTRHFDTISPENLLKWGLVHPQPERYAFEAADRYVAFGEERGMSVIGHTLVWHNQTPAWVFAGADGARADRETLLARMREHIQTVVSRYRGRIRGWDVVNEAFAEDGTWRKSPWYEIAGEDFVAKAFEYAHAADTQAELYYNDFNLAKPAKRAAVVRLVKDLKARGLRVDAVGEQGHWQLARPSLEEIDATLTELAATGVKVMLTELDVDVLPREPGMEGADLAQQARTREATNLYSNGLPEEQQRLLAARYVDIFGLIVKRRDLLTRVTFWGVTDRTSWLNNFPVRGRVNHPLLWDREGTPKPAFAAVADTLRRAR